MTALHGPSDSPLDHLKTVTVELPYEDALRLWVLVFDPDNAGSHRADDRIRKIVSDAIEVTEDNYEEADGKACDSCGSGGRLTYSPLHDAHFCPPCLQREVPDPDAQERDPS